MTVMNIGPSLSRRLLQSAVAVLAGVWALSCAWQLLQPLLPALVAATLLLAGLGWWLRRRREW